MAQKEEPPKESPVTAEVIAQAEKVVGITFTDTERQLMVKRTNERIADYEKLRSVSIASSIAPVLRFDPSPLCTRSSPAKLSRRIRLSRARTPTRPANLERLAFYPVTALSRLIRTRKVSSVELTRMYLTRLRRYNPFLNCVVTFTEELAMSQAERADREISAGDYRGPLHGIPWGAKDLLAVRGVPTTWGALPYKEQVFDYDAAVVEKLEEAGAVLIAKLSMGSLANGDIWFNGQTKNPWNMQEGSSGSSAGSACAVSAGLVGFAIGTETLGSIVSPSTRCGVTGLRPTYGRVSRHGAMALSWSMDKIGPICRTVEDCAIVFNAIHGPDGKDPSLVEAPFRWNPRADPRGIRMGYVKSAFDAERENKACDDQTLEKLRSLGYELVPLELPDYPLNAMSFILGAEAAAAFDELTRSNKDDLLARQDENSWPNTFRRARFIPAVEYINANRLRSMLIEAMAKTFSEVELYVAPSRGPNLTLTNLTGHPAVVVPNGFSPEGRPCSSITFTGRLFGEDLTLMAARTYQDVTDFHKRHPPMKYGKPGEVT